jgi:hypothetical protein
MCRHFIWQQTKCLPSLKIRLKGALQSAFRGCRSTHPAGLEGTMVSTQHEEEMNSEANKANKEETKPAVVYD